MPLLPFSGFRSVKLTAAVGWPREPARPAGSPAAAPLAQSSLLPHRQFPHIRAVKMSQVRPPLPLSLP